MKKFNKNSIVTVIALSLMLGALSLTGPSLTFAANSPPLGAAASYGVLSSSFTNTSASTGINGDVGFTTGPAVVPLGIHTYYGSGYPYSTAGTDQGSALATGLTPQVCTYSFPVGDIDLTTDNQGHPGSIGVFPPGVYCITGAMNISGALTLNGSGTYIFKSTGAMNTTNGSIITMTGASACDVFWTPGGLATLGANTTFFGTIVDASGITVGNTTSWTGRALAFGGTVTTGSAVTITTPPTCSAGVAPLPVPAPTLQLGTITVVKTVINDNGRTKIIADFPLFINGIPVVSGVANSFRVPAGVFTVTEIADPNYTRTFSGDCDVNGQLNLDPGYNKFCIVTNNDIGAPVVVPPVPPLMEVVKVPSPLSLPNGPGPVTYTYTLHNIGTVPVTNITMVGDTCSPIVLSSGDTNGDGKLDVNEVWTYHCTKTITETHTNTVVATGWANGISTVDIASATVVVGSPVVPPLIHVTKIPNPLALSAGGGMVTYTKKVTNPGTVALSNVHLTDDKCSTVKYISGDTNGDSKLDTNETWTYTCQTNLTKTTTNTVIASGDANGMTARDFAVAHVIVASPLLPNTGIGPDEKSIPWQISAGVLIAASILFYLARRKQTI